MKFCVVVDVDGAELYYESITFWKIPILKAMLLVYALAQVIADGDGID